jgi:hypothetical protein
MKNNIENLMIEWFEIVVQLPKGSNSMSGAQEEQLHNIQAEIIERLLFNADKPIFVSHKKLKDIFNKIIPHLLKVDRQFLYERLDGSGKSVEIVCEYLDRFLNLKPFLLISKLPKNVNILLSDAIRSYLHGCNRAAVILCGALLEEILTTELEKIDQNLVYKNENGDGHYQLKMPVIIQNAVNKNLMDKKFKKYAKHVNTERNDAVHKCKFHNDDDTLKIIEKTKSVMENIYERQ